jgi:tRNA 2-thiouridine synthesizing protein A
MNSDKVLDAKGLACPMPIVKTKKAIEELENGQILEVHATDKGAKNDLTAWAKSSGHELVEDTEDEGVFKFWLKKINKNK